MELSLSATYARALKLNEGSAQVPFGKERIRGAQKFKEATLRETAAFLRDFASLTSGKNFSERELARMLGNSCVETASFFFSAGSSNEIWKGWCYAASEAFCMSQDFSYSMQLAAISGAALGKEMGTILRDAELKSYREQVVQFVIFRQSGGRLPFNLPQGSPDENYQSLLHALRSDNAKTLSSAIESIAQYWLNETSYGIFEPGIYPVFEPEINAVVAALLAQGLILEFTNPRIRKFLEAARQ
ncbi:MAG TPA: hypothetical protein VNZ47_01720 [Candidatus Dormibacteraeota bacterium]|nr:hypothetical protein [Candidatus Dormibacteraeota bacterium]